MPGEGDGGLALRREVEANGAAQRRQLPGEDHLGELAGLLSVSTGHLGGDEGNSEAHQGHQREGELGTHPLGAVGVPLEIGRLRARRPDSIGIGDDRSRHRRRDRITSQGPRCGRATMLPPSASTVSAHSSRSSASCTTLAGVTPRRRPSPPGRRIPPGSSGRRHRSRRRADVAVRGVPSVRSLRFGPTWVGKLLNTTSLYTPS